MIVNTSGLRKETMSQNKTAISNLSKAREQFATKIEMPERFAYSYLLNNISERIKKIEEKVSELNSYIDRKAEDFEKAEKEAERLASSLNVAMLNNPDYEYYMMTQRANKQSSNNALFPCSDASLEQKYEATMANVRDKNFLSFLNAVSKIGQTTVYAKEHSTQTDKVFHVSENVDLYKIIKEDLDGDAIQGMAYDGSNVFLSIGKKQQKVDEKGNIVYDDNGKIEKEDSGVIIAKYNFEASEIKVIFENLWDNPKIGKQRAAHGESIAYNSASNAIVIKNNLDKEKSVFEINKETLEVTEFKIPKKYRAFTYSEKRNELIGLSKNDKTLTFLERDEKAREYKKSDIVKLDYNKDFKNIQGMSCDEEYIYIYQSDQEEILSKDEWKTYVFNYEGKKIDEYKIGEGFIHWEEIESGFTDKDDNLWICGPFEIAKVINYTSPSKASKDRNVKLALNK